MANVWQRIATLWWTLGAGVLLFLWPLFMIGHLTRTFLEHRRHGDWRSTLLALSWPVLCVGMVGVLGGNMSPPLFGIPLLLVFSTAWLKPRGSFALGVGLFYLLATVVVVAVALSDDGQLRWGFLALWPVSLAVLLLWRSARLAALESEV